VLGYATGTSRLSRCSSRLSRRSSRQRSDGFDRCGDLLACRDGPHDSTRARLDTRGVPLASRGTCFDRCGDLLACRDAPDDSHRARLDRGGAPLASRGTRFACRGRAVGSSSERLGRRAAPDACRDRTLACRGRTLACRGRTLACRGRTLACRGRTLACPRWSGASGGTEETRIDRALSNVDPRRPSSRGLLFRRPQRAAIAKG
jgi:hypothetical protein